VGNYVWLKRALKLVAARIVSLGKAVNSARRTGTRKLLQSRLGRLLATQTSLRAALEAIAAKPVILGVGTGVVLVAAVTTVTLMAASSTITGGIELNNGASATTTSAITIDSTVSNAVDMRIGPPAVKAAVGYQHVISIDSSGALWAWGYNYYGQLGDGSNNNTTTPIPIGTDTDWESVSASNQHSAFLKKDGTLYTCGQNTDGQLGIGSTTPTGTLTMVGVPGEWESVTCGYTFMLGIKKDGSLWAWGDNGFGQIGIGGTTDQTLPIRIGADNDWSSVSAGYASSYAIKDNGTLWSWGWNNSLELGYNTQSSVPMQVAAGTTWKSVTAGLMAVAAIKSDGSLYTWGNGANGQLGDGTNNARTTPTKIDNGPFVQAAGRTHVIALKSDGSVWTWGSNQYGQVGDGTYGNTRLSMSQVATGATSVVAGDFMSAAFKADGMYTWGISYSGTLGGSYGGYQLRPLLVNTDWQPYVGTRSWQLQESDGTHTVSVEFRDAEGGTTCFSDQILYDSTPPSGTTIVNDGVAATKNTTVFIRSNITNVVDMRIGEGNWSAYASNSSTTVASGDGTKTISVDYRDEWGRIVNSTTPLLLDTAAPSGTMAINAGDSMTRFFTASAQSTVSADSIAMRIEPPAGWKQVVLGGGGIWGIRSDGTLCMSGYSSHAGDGLSSSDSFRAVADGTTWNYVAVPPQSYNSQTIGVRADGSLWAWGSNYYYQLADGTNTARRVPNRIGVDSDWKMAATSGDSVSAIKNNGTLWTWGLNSSGECGLGTTATANTASPQTTLKQVMAPATWKGISSNSAAGAGYSIALMTDGTLWTWGYNNSSQLGNGSKTANSKPQRPTGTAAYSDWTTCTAGNYTAYAIRANGDLWAWGDNWYGQIGDGTSTSTVVAPKLVGTGYKSVAAGSGHVFAVKTNGELWGWGANYSSQLGDGGTVNKKSPTRLGTRSDWVSVSVAGSMNSGMTSDGRLWAWGSGSKDYADSLSTVRTTPVSADWFVYSNNTPFRLSGGNGTKTVNVIVRDLAGNETTLTDSISLDTSASAGSVTINGGAEWSSSPTVTVTSSVPNSVSMCEGAPVRALTAANGTSGFVRSDGVLLMSGSNYRSKLGTAGAVNQGTPVMSTNMRQWAWVGTGAEHTLALTTDGTLYSWGGNVVGQLGTGDTLDRATPYLIGVPGEWAQVSVGAYHNLAVKKNGSMWSWGSRYDGALGDATAGGWWPTPQQIGGTSDWKYVSAGVKHSLAVRNNGELWAWGTGTNGQLGLGSGITLRYVPTRVGTATNWASVSAGTDHSLGVTVDGSLYAWGDRYRGQIGEGNIALNNPIWSPLKLDGSGFTAVSAGEYTSYAIRSDGSLWGWGYNNTNLINSYTTWGVTTPARMGTASDWAAVDAGNGFTVAAKANGSVWTWGSNTNGELGNAGTGNDPKVPSQIMARTWVPYATSSTVRISYPVGDAPVTVGFRDVAGNVTWLSDNIKFDLTPPSTSATGAPAGWSTTPVNLQFVLSQPEESGLAGIKYRINGDAEQDYTLLQTIPITTEGTTVVSWYGTDLLGNVETARSATVTVDTVKPVTTSTLTGEWVPTDTVTLSRSDATSGIRNTYYSVDGASATTYTATFTVPEGMHAVRYWSVDVAGNVEDTVTVTSKVDLTAPTSEASGIPAGWSASNATVSLSATDALSGGVTIRYSIDGAPGAQYDEPLIIGNGVHGLAWSALDAAGNREATQTATVKVDTTAPSTESDSDGKWHAGPVSVTLTATDTLSGVAESFYRLDGGADVPYLVPFTISAEGTTSVDFWSKDAMGNTEPNGSTQVKIDYTAPVTTISGVPSVEVTQAVSLVLSATDGGSGIAKLYYRLNGGARRPYVSGQTSLILATEGTTTVEYWSVDGVSNAETPKSATVRIRYPSSVSPTSKNPTCVACHGAPTGPRRVRLDFSVGDVDRATACPRCHVGSLAGTHPFHNATANCGAFCHIGWGSAMASAIPNVSTAYGAFVATSSATLSSDELHVLHASARWPATADKDSSRCGSCHAQAACDACHSSGDDPVDAGHAAHSATGNALYPAVAPLAATVVGYGVPAGDQTKLTTTIFAGQCATTKCHNVPGVRATDAVVREDYSHPANAASGLTTNTVVTTGTWKPQYAAGFSSGRLSFSTTLGATHAITFTGQRVSVIVDSGPNRGIAEVYLDGALQTTFDAYATTAKAATAWESGTLGAGTHTITVKVKGTKNAKATTTSVAVDYYRVWPNLPRPVSPLCSSCHPAKVADHGYGDADHVADGGSDIEPISGATCSACHSMDLLTEHERVGSVSKGGTCITCHEAPRKSFASWNQSCQQGGCHTPETTQERHAGLPDAHRVATAMTCTRNCHEALLPGEHTKVNNGRASVDCVSCHGSTKYQAKARTVAWDRTCTTCHADSHVPVASGNGLCYDCHGSSDTSITAVAGSGAYAATGGDHEPGYDASIHGSAVVTGTDGGVDAGIQCDACHNHNAIAVGSTTSLRANGTDAPQAELCFGCHSASGDETRTATPNTWNGRDIAEEFSRMSHHPVVGTSESVASSVATLVAFTQSSGSEFALDTAFQMAPTQLYGAQLQNTGKHFDLAPRKLVFKMPIQRTAFDQYDPEIGHWNSLDFDPIDTGVWLRYYSPSATVLGNRLHITDSGYRRVYTPPTETTGTGSWAALSDLPALTVSNPESTPDEAHGLIYYGTGGTSTIYPWRAADDTWLTPIDGTFEGESITYSSEAAMAYSPESDKLFFKPQLGPAGGRLLSLTDPSGKSGSQAFESCEVTLSGGSENPYYPATEMQRFARGGHDYLAFSGHDESGAEVFTIVGNLAGAVQTLNDTGRQLVSANGQAIAWDGGEYLYSASTGPLGSENLKRIHIPEDPMGAWPAWEVLPSSLNTGEGAVLGVLDALVGPYDTNIYTALGTLSAEVDAPSGATTWDQLDFDANKPALTNVTVKVEGWNGSDWETVSGMGALQSGPVDLSNLSTAMYPRLRLTASLSTADDYVTPSLKSWTVTALSPSLGIGAAASLTCANCHNSHLVKRGGTEAWDPARVSDPANTKLSVSSTTQFCLDCHSAEAISATKTTAKVVPYSVQFRAFGSDSLFAGWSKQLGGIGFLGSGHATSAGTRAQCETCHDPHGSDNAALTAWTRPAGFTAGVAGVRDNSVAAAGEENLCFQCHGNGTTGVQADGALDVATAVSSIYSHSSAATGSAHVNSETAAENGTKRHAECVDCHNVHTARAGSRIAGAPVASPALLGATGLKPVWGDTPWSTATTFTVTQLQGRRGDTEAYVCFKCHAAASGRPAAAKSGGSDYTSTDLALEFNPSNPSYHNVLGLSTGMRSAWVINGQYVSFGLPAAKDFFKPGWDYNSTVTCSDCHTSESVGQAKGPHGSSAPFMIDSKYDGDYKTAMLDFTKPTGVTENIVCLKCHVLNRQTNNAHGTNGYFGGAYAVHSNTPCVACHIRIPHGWKRPRLIGYTDDPAPYRSGYDWWGWEGLTGISMRSHNPSQWWDDDCSVSCTSFQHDSLRFENRMP